MSVVVLYAWLVVGCDVRVECRLWIWQFGVSVLVIWDSRLVASNIGMVVWNIEVIV